MVVNLGLERIEPKHREKKVSLGYMRFKRTHGHPLSAKSAIHQGDGSIFYKDICKYIYIYIDNGSQSDHANDPIDAPGLSSKLFLKWARTWRGKLPKA